MSSSSSSLGRQWTDDPSTSAQHLPSSSPGVAGGSAVPSGVVDEWVASNATEAASTPSPARMKP